VATAAGQSNQGSYAIAVGTNAGYQNQGASAIAVGTNAGRYNQHDNSIVLNASGSNLDTAQASSFYVKPVRGGNIAASALAYTSAGEIVEETNVHFDASGNVGIGTASPREYIHIQYPNPDYNSYNNAQISNVVISSGTEISSAGLFFRTPYNNTAPPKCALIASGGVYSGANGRLDICFDTTNSNDPYYRATQAKAKVTFKANGNVGIGTTNLHTTWTSAGPQRWHPHVVVRDLFGPDQVSSFGAQCVVKTTSTTGAIDSGGVLAFSGHDGASSERGSRQRLHWGNKHKNETSYYARRSGLYR
jgi:hypothetical protein